MNRSFSIVSCALIALMLVSFVSAQSSPSMDELFKQIATLSNTKKPEDMEKAFQLSKDFLKRFGNEKDNRIAKVKTFYVKYRDPAFYAAIDGKKYPEAFALGKEILAEQPNNVDVLMNLAFAGYNATVGTKDRVFADDTISFAKRTSQLFDAGTMPKEFFPFKDKSTAVAFMHYIAGVLSFEQDMNTGIVEIYRATLVDSAIKDSADPYSMIASYYESQYESASKVLNTKVEGKALSDADYKTEKARVDNILESLMDAYARTVTRAETEKNPNLSIWKPRLVQIYKFKNKTEDGLVEFIKYANTKPMAEPKKF
ncbi:MAG TPA: hypothetical protein PLP07_08760 [Pyrinomonadaceae bacterium]|nr:hypothetical protein [Chloracidobacterium sp.]MBP9108043.1 hypothetical protein [Pyrinomonadaceae bacterium]MBK7801995.1 hypothetical protein [Chloracidobacterium sp.]MBK9437862.1 hypothetical protein [Chloracidobacterium sp.]MBL0242298.1 hypothetical protein [Chloracidobacterium sp.]